MEVFFVIRRKKTVLYLDAKEKTTVTEVKLMISGITKVSPENQQLFKDDVVMEPSRTLSDYDLTIDTATANSPAIIGLAYKDEATGEFEALEIESFSKAPKLPELPLLEPLVSKN